VTYDSWIAVACIAVVLALETRGKLAVDFVVHRAGFVAGTLTGWWLRIRKDEDPDEIAK